jgi:hypothetical protein
MAARAATALIGMSLMAPEEEEEEEEAAPPVLAVEWEVMEGITAVAEAVADIPIPLPRVTEALARQESLFSRTRRRRKYFLQRPAAGKRGQCLLIGIAATT